MEEPGRRASVSGATAATHTNERTNIKVFCRLRQQNQMEKREGATQCSTVLNKSTIILRNSKCDVDEIRCTFDGVFDIQSKQEEVYEHAAKPLVQDFLLGYNCTIFAYGQTGSGKTHTILGPRDGIMGKPEDEGIISRVIRDLFGAVDAIQRGTNIDLTASFVEIYMEQIRDLLVAVPPGPPTSSGSLKIRENSQRGVYIEEMVQVSCKTESEMLDIVRTGTMNRSVSSTRMNKDSSRSHCILMIGASQKEHKGAVVKRSMMYIVDLAGSEFVNKTNASGKILQEAKSINKSLAALSNVIKALGEAKKHIPYRDSKLTRLLQDSLGGSAKTCLILAASCSSYNMSETISTLRFGLRAKEIKNPVVIKQESSLGPAGIFKELYQQALEDIDEKNRKIDEMQQLLALSHGTSFNKHKSSEQNFRAVATSPMKILDTIAWNCQNQKVTPTGNDDSSSDAENEGNIDQENEDEDDTGDDDEDDEKDSKNHADDNAAQSDVYTKAALIDELAESNQRLDGENKRLFKVLESLENQLDQIVVSKSSGNYILRVRKAEHENALSLKILLQSESWKQEADYSEEDATYEESSSTEETADPKLSESSNSTHVEPNASDLKDTASLPDASCCSSSEGVSHCVHRVDSEKLSRQIVELKLQLHYLNESAKQTLEGEEYLIVLENAKLKTRIEELEFQANLGNVRCNQLEMKNRACETRLSNQETHITCLQNSLQEYQGLFKQQVIMSQEKCRLLTDELEFYKKLAKYASSQSLSVAKRSSLAISTPQSEGATVSPPSPPRRGRSASMSSPRSLGTDNRSGATSPLRKALSVFSKTKNERTSPGGSPVVPLTVRAQRMIVKPTTNSVDQDTSGNLSPWRRKGFEFPFASSANQFISARTYSAPHLASKQASDDSFFDELIE